MSNTLVGRRHHFGELTGPEMRGFDHSAEERASSHCRACAVQLGDGGPLHCRRCPTVLSIGSSTPTGEEYTARACILQLLGRRDLSGRQQDLSE